MLTAFRSTLSLLALCLIPAVAGGQNFVLVSSVVGSGAVQGTSTNFKVLGTVGQPAIGTGSSTNFAGSWGFWYTLSGTAGGGFLADLQLLLQGPYTSGGMMGAGIQRDSIPENQPFNTAPWNYAGGESVASGFFAANTDIVDWIYIEVRDTSPAPPSAMTPLASRAALLKTDGTVVDTDGTSAVSFPSLSAGTYYIVVDHRNHIRAMSAAGVASVNDTLAYDFTDALAKSYTPGAAAPVKMLEASQFGLFAGDGSKDGQVTATDFNNWLTATSMAALGYNDSDFNLDGQVLANDFNIWLTNTKAAAASQVPNP